MRLYSWTQKLSGRESASNQVNENVATWHAMRHPVWGQYTYCTTWLDNGLPCECPEFQTAAAFQFCYQQATPVDKADSRISRVTSGNISLVPRPRAPPGEKQSGEQSRFSWAYSPKVVRTNEIALSGIIMQHFSKYLYLSIRTLFQRVWYKMLMC